MVWQLLLAAMQRDRCCCTQHLCKLPGAQELSSDAVSLLLHTAVLNSAFDGVEVVCGLPAAEELSSKELGVLLRASCWRQPGVECVIHSVHCQLRSS